MLQDGREFVEVLASEFQVIVQDSHTNYSALHNEVVIDCKLQITDGTSAKVMFNAKDPGQGAHLTGKGPRPVGGRAQGSKTSCKVNPKPLKEHSKT
jgi:hypothetical protein